ncbi:MAG: hypothetical protein KGH72_05690 [Candidatus Micrarchaeota archaeon]|nr:hypothetical protein [Candidatus Micrarchaeota archaeon]
MSSNAHRIRSGAEIMHGNKASGPLTSDTKVKSPYEEAVKEVLLELGIRSYYEPFRIRLPSGAVWEPDFLMYTPKGKAVILEPHRHALGRNSGRKRRRDRKLQEAMEACGGSLYIVDIALATRLYTSNLLRDIPENVAHERWNLPRMNFDPDLDIETKKGLWKHFVRAHLEYMIIRLDSDGERNTNGFRPLLRPS